jgi:hypothetical protein
MFSVPEGRAANQPLAATTFSPPIGALLPGVRVSLAVKRRTPVSIGAEADRLIGVAHVRPALIILSFESRQIDQHLSWSGLARKG